MAKTIRHMSVDLNGLLKITGKKSLKGFMTDDNGHVLSDKECRDYIQECLDKGWVCIPLGSSGCCPDFDYFGGGCPGHKVEE